MKARTVLLTASLLLAVGLGWVVWRHSKQGGRVSAGAQGVSLAVRINNVEIQPIGDHAHLILTAVFDQSGTTPLRLEPPLLSLLATPDQTPAARYLGPMLPDPVLAGPEPTEIMLHYWLPLADLKSPLILDAAGQRQPLTLPGR